MASQEWFVTRKCITNIWNDKYDCLLPIADACWDFLSFVSIQLHLQKPCEGCQEVNFPPILTWLWNIWCFASLINCWLVHLYTAASKYMICTLWNNQVFVQTFIKERVLDLSCQSLHVFDLFLSRNIFINTTLSVRFAIKQAVRQIYLWGMLGNASCPDWHAALVVSEVCESSGGDKFSSVACPLTISSMNSISAFSWALFRTETSFHSKEHVDKMQK